MPMKKFLSITFIDFSFLSSVLFLYEVVVGSKHHDIYKMF